MKKTAVTCKKHFSVSGLRNTCVFLTTMYKLNQGNKRAKKMRNQERKLVRTSASTAHLISSKKFSSQAKTIFACLCEGPVTGTDHKLPKLMEKKIDFFLSQSCIKICNFTCIFKIILQDRIAVQRLNTLHEK